MTTRTYTRGFSLLELIAVMAILAILAGTLAPSVFRAIDEGFASAEATNLTAMAESLEAYVLDTKRVPSRTTADWSAAIAGYMGVPLNRVERNERDFSRGVYFDPRFMTTTDVAFPGFTQSLGLGAAPNSPRVMIVSNLQADAPAAPTTFAAFDSIWNQTGTPGVVESKMVKIERLNLRDIWHRVLLTNDNGAAAGFRLEAGSQGSVAGAAGTPGTETRWVIEGTRLGLFSHSYPSGSLQSEVIARSDLSFNYGLDGAVWRWSAP